MSRIRTRAQRLADKRAHDQAVARAVMEGEPSHRRTETPKSRLDEELDLLRGIPVIGVLGGRGGAIPGTKPGSRPATSATLPPKRTANSREAQRVGSS